MPSSNKSELLFATLIGSAVALNTELGNGRWPQARHHVRLVAARAVGAGRPQIRISALNLLTALNAAIRPASEIWKPRLAELNRVIDEALDDVESLTAD